MVFDGRVYPDTSHDDNVTLDNFFTMYDWRLYSTVDMVNWTDHRSRISVGPVERLGSAKMKPLRTVCMVLLVMRDGQCGY
jgi:hypothetical protein